MTDAEKKRVYGTDTYAQWDDFDDEDGKDEIAEKKPTRYDLGEGGFEPRDVKHITDAEVAAMKKVARSEKKEEVWQVSVRQLRVWAASERGGEGGSWSTTGRAEDGPVPCRPHCILIGQLYPSGRLMGKNICSPPEDFPAPTAVLAELFQIMRDPPGGEPMHRPPKVVFVDRVLAEELYNSLALIGIEVSVLSEAEGFGG
jgi:hypothetical protein